MTSLSSLSSTEVLSKIVAEVSDSSEMPDTSPLKAKILVQTSHVAI